MRIGFVVDGEGETRALPRLLARVSTHHELLTAIVKGEIQPKALPTRIARSAAKACQSLALRRVDLAVVLLDLEDRDECPGALAASLHQLIGRQLHYLGVTLEVAVVLKVRAFENWLVADLQSLRAMPKLFPELGAVVRAVPTGNADGVDALTILHHARGRRGRYDKMKGAVAICTHLDPGRAALNSRSFRRFLRILEDSRYLSQSRLPNRET